MHGVPALYPRCPAPPGSQGASLCCQPHLLPQHRLHDGELASPGAEWAGSAPLQLRLVLRILIVVGKGGAGRPALRHSWPTAAGSGQRAPVLLLQRLSCQIREAVQQQRYPQFVRDCVARHYPAGDWPEWVCEGCRLAGISLDTTGPAQKGGAAAAAVEAGGGGGAGAAAGASGAAAEGRVAAAAAADAAGGVEGQRAA